jgi:hypothetical protein
LWSEGDVTYDGLVDFNDLVKLAQNYNAALPTTHVAGAPADFDNDLAAVPEPSIFSLFAACCFAPFLRRPRRRPHPS